MIEFLNYLSKYISITLEDVAFLHKKLPTYSLSKDAYLLKNEPHNKCFYFLEKGEIELSIKTENGFKQERYSSISFFSTYNYQHKNKYKFNIKSIKNTQYVEISLEHLLTLVSYNPKFKKLPSLMQIRETTDEDVMDW